MCLPPDGGNEGPTRVVENPAMSAPTPSAPDAARIVIRGRSLLLDELVDPRLHDPDYVEALHGSFEVARPFPHAVTDAWFNPLLLELVAEEFDASDAAGWVGWKHDRQDTFRSALNPRLGPAASTYFSIVNSGWFAAMLARVVGVAHLVPDPSLYGGGLHESRNGGKFGVHRDFPRHPVTGLRNELVLLTYLNVGWRPEWNGALELWDEDARREVIRIEPDMGRSVLLRHGPHSYHGHPRPLAMPPGRVRRSLGSYYYSSPIVLSEAQRRLSSRFLPIGRGERVKEALRAATPPVLWDGLKRLLGRE